MNREQVLDLSRQILDASRRARDLVAGLSTERLERRPRDGSWSVADNLVHLTLAAQAAVPRLEERVRRLAQEGRRSDRSSRLDIVGRLLRWSLEPPPRFKTKAPPRFRPSAGVSAAAALPGFLAEQDRILALLKEAEGLDLGAARIRSAFSRRVRYNLYSAFCILAAHERRHLWQAEQAALALPHE